MDAARLAGLPAVHENIDADNPIWPQCGVPLNSMPGAEDSEVAEIEVKAYACKTYRTPDKPQRDCDECSAIVRALLVPKVIFKGSFGISVWRTAPLDKSRTGWRAP